LNNELSAMSNEPITLTVDGTEYKFGRLTIADFAATESYIADKRLQRMIQLTQTTPYPSDVRAQMMAQAGAAPVNVTDLYSFDGRLFMLARSMQQYDPSVTVGNVLQKLPRISPEQLVELQRMIEGLPTETDDAADPTAHMMKSSATE